MVLQEGLAYEGELLNASHNLQAHTHGSRILFLALPEAEYPFLVTPTYLAERGAWDVTPCDRCGIPELFDAPSDLLRALFPNLGIGDVVANFTSFCSLCGGFQVVQAKDVGAQREEQAARKWWQV